MDQGIEGQRPKKIAIIGAGNIGKELWKILSKRGAADEIVVQNRSNKWDNPEFQGMMKAVDQGNQIHSNYKNPTNFRFTQDMDDAVSGADIVIVTAGAARKAGQSRGDLMSANAEVVRPVADAARRLNRDANYIIATNPVDTMTKLFQEESGVAANKVLGLSGELDRARFVQAINEQMQVSPQGVHNAHVVGQHGPKMVPLVSQVEIEYPGQPKKKLSELLEGRPDKMAEIIAAAVGGGGRMVQLLGTSDHVAPAAALQRMTNAIIDAKYRGEHHDPIYASSLNEGANTYIGQPVTINADGTHSVQPIQGMSQSEQVQWRDSIDACQKDLSQLPDRISTVATLEGHMRHAQRSNDSAGNTALG